MLESVPENIVTPGNDCAAPPEILVPVGVDQLNFVPEGMIPLVPSVGVSINEIPLQVVLLIGVIMASGLRLSVRVNAAPTQVPDLGVMV